MSARGALAALAAGLLTLLLAAGAPLPGVAAEWEASEDRATSQTGPAGAGRSAEGASAAPDAPDAVAGLRPAVAGAYSVNDKVVVFDRVRENLARGQPGDLAETVDRSLNAVLGRCLVTSATTLAALVPMAVWGGPAVAALAAPMIAGVVIATASSLLVAGPLLVRMTPEHLPVATPALKSS